MIHIEEMLWLKTLRWKWKCCVISSSLTSNIFLFSELEAYFLLDCEVGGGICADVVEWKSTIERQRKRESKQDNVSGFWWMQRRKTLYFYMYFLCSAWLNFLKGQVDTMGLGKHWTKIDIAWNNSTTEPCKVKSFPSWNTGVWKVAVRPGRTYCWQCCCWVRGQGWDLVRAQTSCRGTFFVFLSSDLRFLAKPYQSSFLLLLVFCPRSD